MSRIKAMTSILAGVALLAIAVILSVLADLFGMMTQSLAFWIAIALGISGGWALWQGIRGLRSSSTS